MRERGPARETFVAAVRELRQAAEGEADRLVSDAVRARNRGLTIFAKDLVGSEGRLRWIALLADKAIEEARVPRGR